MHCFGITPLNKTSLTRDVDRQRQNAFGFSTLNPKTSSMTSTGSTFSRVLLALQSSEAKLQSEAACEALQQQLAAALAGAEAAAATAAAAAAAVKEQQESLLEAAARRQAELESQVAELESSRAEVQSQYEAAKQALGEATAKAGAALSGGGSEGRAADDDAAAATAAAAVEAAERESAELRAALAAVEKQLKGLQDVVATERKAHASSLGDQVWPQSPIGSVPPWDV